MVAKFIFGGDTQETPETLKRKRGVLEAMAAQRRGTPQNVGEGLQAIGDALAYRMKDARLRKQEGFAQQQSNDIMSQIAAALAGGGGLGGPAPGAGGGNGNTSAMDFSGGTGSATGIDVAQKLQSDLGLSPGAAAGIAGNLAAESGDFKNLQEINPLVKGSRGGYGWAQWTGPRRVAFENWAQQNGLSASSPEANYGYLLHELKNTPEGSVLSSLQGVDDPSQAAQIFSEKFLRPGIPHMSGRVSRANSIYQGLGQGGGVQTASLDPSSGVAEALAQQMPDVSRVATPEQMAQRTPLGGNQPQGGGFQIVPPNNEGLATPGGQNFLQTMTNPQSMMGGGVGPMQMGSPMQGSPRAQPQMDRPQGPGAPGEIRQGPGGQNFQNVETTGMLGATGSQGWIPTSQGNLPQQQAPVQVAQNGGGMDMQQLLKLAQNPYAPPEAKQMIFNLLQSQWEQRQKQNDPKTQMDLQKEQLEIQRLQNPTTDDITEYNTYAKQAQAAGEQPKSFYEYQTTVKRAGANNMSVNQPFESQYAKDYGAGRAKLKLGIEDAASNAYDSNNNLDVMEQSLNDPRFYSGTGADQVAGLKRFAVGIGLADPSEVSSVEQFGSIANKLVLNQMGGSLGTGFSNADRDFVKDQVPSLRYTPEGNRQLIGIMRKLNERKIQIAEMADDYASQHGGQLDAGWNSQLRKFAKENPLFPKVEKAPAQGGSPKNPADMTDEEIRKELDQ